MVVWGLLNVDGCIWLGEGGSGRWGWGVDMRDPDKRRGRGWVGEKTAQFGVVVVESMNAVFL